MSGPFLRCQRVLAADYKHLLSIHLAMILQNVSCLLQEVRDVDHRQRIRTGETDSIRLVRPQEPCGFAKPAGDI